MSDLFTPDPFAICDEPTADDFDAEWRAQAWEECDEMTALGYTVETPPDVADAETRARYSEHLRRAR